MCKDEFNNWPLLIHIFIQQWVFGVFFLQMIVGLLVIITMAGIISEVGQFDENKEEWSSYAERVILFFDAKEIPNERRVLGFLSMLGGRTYGVLKSLLLPARPQDHRLDYLVTRLQNHYMPRPLVIAERYRFHKLMQSESEIVAQYLVALKGLSQNCEFGVTLNERLRDQLVLGLRTIPIQRKLFAENDLTVDQALAIANSMEKVQK